MQVAMRKARPERNPTFTIEDNNGRKTSFHPFLSRNEFDYMVSLKGNEDFLGFFQENRQLRPVSPESRPSSPFFPMRSAREAGANRSFLAGEIPHTQEEISRKSWTEEHGKMVLAQKMLNDLKSWYEGLFPEEQSWEDKAHSSRQAFFNSSLIYFIATADDSEDNVGHSQFVASYTVLLAKALGIMDKRSLIDLERGALLHDIGKIGMPVSILKKSGSLTMIEKEIIKDHPLLGYKLIQEHGFLEPAAQVVLFHHEYYDGRGYPFGLAGEGVPLEARIFALADTLDAITSDRPYREGGSIERAMREIEKCSGSQFDPMIVDVFLSIPKEKWLQAKQETWEFLRLPSAH